MPGMKIIIIALTFLAVTRLSGVIARENADLQSAAIILSGPVIARYAAKVICLACRERDTAGSRHDSRET